MCNMFFLLLVLTQDQKSVVQLEKTGSSRTHTAYITAVSLSNNGKLAASGDVKGMVRVWSTDEGLKESSDFRAALGEGVEQKINDLAFSPDGKLLAAACDDKTIWIWDIQSKKLLRRQRGHEDHVTQIVFAPDGKKAISVDSRKNCLTWNVLKDQVPVRYNFSASRIAISQDGKRMSVTDGNITFVAETSSGKIIQKIGSYCDQLCFTSDGKHVVKGKRFDELEAYETQTGRRIWSSRSQSRLRLLFITPDRKRLHSISESALFTWNAANGDLLEKVEMQSAMNLTEAAFSPDGKFLLVGGNDGELGLYTLSPAK